MGTSIHCTRERNLNSKMNLILFSLMLVSAGAVPSPVGSPVGSPTARAVPSPVGSPVGSPISRAVPSPVGSPVGSPTARAVPSPVGSPVGSPTARAVPSARQEVSYDCPDPGMPPMGCGCDQQMCRQDDSQIMVGPNANITVNCPGPVSCEPMYQTGNDPRVQCPVPCPGSTCPADDDMECPEGSDELGCPKAPTCRPMWMPDQNGALTCPNTCPMVCEYNQQRCEIHDHSDPNCPDKKTYSCVSDNSDLAAAACMEYCPPDCGPDQMPCPGQMDANNCAPASTCYPSMLPDQNGDLTCSNACPLVCAANQQQCQTPANDSDCPGRMNYSCISDNSDPALPCMEHCPPPCTADQVLCPGPMDESNCAGASSCADTPEDCLAV